MISQANKFPIQLRGSIDIIVDFFKYSINSILYQRGIYSHETFTREEKYGLPLSITTDPQLIEYLDVVLSQMRKFLASETIHKIVIVILRLETLEPVERWQFDVELIGIQNNNVKSICNSLRDAPKAQKEVQDSIGGVLRQITASISFLPTLKGSHSFDILLYTDKNTELPNSEWGDTNAKLINNGQDVPLRGFSTNLHNVKSVVTYAT